MTRLPGARRALGKRTRDELTDAQKRFAEAYVRCNYAKGVAANEAGISATSVAAMLRLQKVRDYIATIQDSAVREVNISARRSIREAAALAFSQITDVVYIDGGRLILRDLDDLPPEVRAAIKTVKIRRRVVASGTMFDEDSGDPIPAEVTIEHVEVTMHDKVAGLRLLMEAQGLIGREGDRTEERETQVWTGVDIIPPIAGGS